MTRLLQTLALGAILLGCVDTLRAEPCFDSRSGCDSCANCGPGCGRGGCGLGFMHRRMGPSSGGGKYAYSSPCTSYGMAPPSSAQWPTVAYPYYTTRGPRDFLVNNPPSIGR